jgi:opacity protein-like surface antigen
MRPLLCAALLALCLLSSAAAAAQTLQLESQVFAGGQWVSTQEESFNEFYLSRAEVGLWSFWDQRRALGAELRLEAVRAAGPQSVLGVDGDSLVLRVKRGWGFVRHHWGPVAAEGRLGLIPDPWVDVLVQHYQLRGLSASLSERGLFFDTSDLGAALHLDLWGGLAQVRLAATNGQGRNQVEQNTGKNTTALLVLRPLSMDTPTRPTELRLVAAWRDGSQGVGSSRDHRLALGALWTSPWVDLGLEWLQAWGYLGLGQLKARGVGAWASGPLGLPWLGGALRLDHLLTDVEQPDTSQLTATGALYVDLAEPGLPPAPRRMRVYLAYSQETFGQDAGALPGAPALSDLRRVMLLLSVGSAWQSPELVPPGGRP